MKYQLRLVTTNNRELTPTLIFNAQTQSGDNYYMFGCPDGIQRQISSQNLKFPKVGSIFLPSNGIQHCLGLGGFLLSQREQRRACLTIEQRNNYEEQLTMVYGAQGFEDLFLTGTLFVPGYDTTGTIFSYPITSTDQGQMTDQFQWNESLGSLAFKDDLVTICPLPSFDQDTQDQLPCYSFLIIPKQRIIPKFLPQKAKELGCNPKLHYKKLTMGEQVTLEDGTLVLPEQVTEPAPPASAALLCFFPKEAYLNSFVSLNASLLDMLASLPNQNTFALRVVYHSVPYSVVKSVPYRQFMNSFKNVHHILDVLETNREEISIGKSFHFSHMIKQICPLLIRISDQDLQDYNLQLRQELSQQMEQDNLTYSHSEMGMQVEMTTDVKINNNEAIRMTTELFTQNQKELEEQRLLSQDLAATLDFDQETLAQLNGQEKTIEEPEFLFLGTCSMKPTTFRGASSIYYFNADKSAGMLMDSAEGSYGQLWNHFNSKTQLDDILLKTRIVFITHIHGDHQLGLMKILKERDMLEPQTPIYCVLPYLMHEWVFAHMKELRHKDMIKIVDSRALNPEPCYYYQNWTRRSLQGVEPDTSLPLAKVCEEREVHPEAFVPSDPIAVELFKEVLPVMGLTHLISVEVDHCPQSYACCLLSQSGQKYLYSGDTLPVQNLMNYAKNATVLIHEATHSSELKQEAYYSKHTTTDQAVQIHQKCNVWRTIFTHFSQRTPKISEIDHLTKENKILVALDHMRVGVSQLEWAWQATKLYEKLITNDDVKEETEVDDKEEKKEEPKQKGKKNKNNKKGQEF